MWQSNNGAQFESYEDAVRHYGGDLEDDYEDECQELAGDHAVFLYYARFPLRCDTREDFARCY
jgi:hypothetical protein